MCAGARETAKARRQCLPISRGVHIPCRSLAIVHMGLGETDRALDWLEKGCDRHEGLGVLNVHPLYEPLRPHPRFQNILRRMRVA